MSGFFRQSPSAIVASSNMKLSIQKSMGLFSQLEITISYIGKGTKIAKIVTC